ncbi:hypothetical protein O6H91_12G019400 [Diphasiastrum complanatum]|uniref:Uncharacterized protein n=1 Tax=Diphasiastrum complanatum TaxID=34168 RepID=A0ACC2BZD4_DIPCM|nr:hypothetical protein O6H91_12G019400 [Diphasiastrum complanatum]
MENDQDEEKVQLLEDGSDYYNGEKEPQDKVASPEQQHQQVDVVGLPVRPADLGARLPWTSHIFACFGSNDGFCSSDLEICVLGSFVPCVLYGSNVERLDPTPGTFCNHCLGYSSLFFLGNFIFNTNCLAPCFSFPVRSAIRRKFNLQGTGETVLRSVGCCTGMLESGQNRERCEVVCDFAMHFCCHPCALCQEGREIRRRLPNLGFNRRPYHAMLPPGEQMMAP